MIKHTETIRWQQPTNCLSVFEHLVGLAKKIEKLITEKNCSTCMFVAGHSFCRIGCSRFKITSQETLGNIDYRDFNRNKCWVNRTAGEL